MTAAAIVFFITSVCLGYERLKHLGRSYPALRALMACSGAFALMIAADYMTK